MTIQQRKPVLFDPEAGGQPIVATSLKIATVTWAELQALSAATYVGTEFRVSDVGVGGGGYFVADGTYWLPKNGHLVLSAENLSAITSTQLMGSGVLTAIPGWTLAIPAGLFDRPGAMLRGMVEAQLEGTVGSGGSPQANIRADFAGGSLASRNLCRTPTLTGANPYGHGLGLMTRIDATTINFVQDSGVPIWSGSASSGGEAGSLATGAFNLYLAGGISTTPGSGETLRFKSVLVELIG